MNPSCAIALEASEASYELAQRINQAGNNTKLDLANERSMYEESKLNLAAAEAEAIDLREHLTGLMGLWGNQSKFTVSARLADPPAEEISPMGLERRAIAQSLDLKLARGETELTSRHVTSPSAGKYGALTRSPPADVRRFGRRVRR